MPLTSLDIDWSLLLEQARLGQSRAYAPYSDFKVGASLLLSSGDVVSACNVENASYGLCMCAERNAIAQVIALGHDVSTMIAMCVVCPGEAVASPCGMCRQVLFEFAPEASVRIYNDDDAFIEQSVSQLLPYAFGPHHLSSGS